MHRFRSALVVAATPSLATKLCAWLKLSGWHVVTAHSYGAAKARLEHRTELLVTELELGEYNGLQLALRAQSYNVPALVVGRHDDVLERDADQLGSTYLRKDELEQHRFMVAVEVQLEAQSHATPVICRDLEFLRRTDMPARLAAPSRRMLLH